MEDRLTQCLNEIIYSDDCPSKLRNILDNVIELSNIANTGDAIDFEDYIQSEDFANDVYEFFGVDINK